MKHIVVIGCGRSGSEMASKLSANGFFVTVVDSNKKSFSHLSRNFSGFTVQKHIVDPEGISSLTDEPIDVLLVVTQNDDLNIYLATAGKEILKIEQVITRLYDDSKAFVFDDIDVDVIYPSKLVLDNIYELMEG